MLNTYVVEATHFQFLFTYYYGKDLLSEFLLVMFSSNKCHVLWWFKEEKMSSFRIKKKTFLWYFSKFTSELFVCQICQVSQIVRFRNKNPTKWHKQKIFLVFYFIVVKMGAKRKTTLQTTSKMWVFFILQIYYLIISFRDCDLIWFPETSNQSSTIHYFFFLFRFIYFQKRNK